LVNPIARIFLSRTQRRLAEQGGLAFIYHSLGPPPRGARDPFLFVAPEKFEGQLRALKDFGLANGSLEAPESPRTVTITFDDGCRNVWEHGLEPLRRHRFTGVQFLVAGLLGKDNAWDVRHGDAPVPLMDVAQVRDWMGAGHAIGSHTLTHRNLTRCTLAEARAEIVDSKQMLEDLFGVEVRHFAYPHGCYNRAIRDLVSDAGYRTACTVAVGANDSSTHSLELRRFAPLSASALWRKAWHRALRKLYLTR
jgi:peptidoglycan/xylan/chitin deacetylase (PgdA/CDA1 family)